MYHSVPNPKYNDRWYIYIQYKRSLYFWTEWYQTPPYVHGNIHCLLRLLCFYFLMPGRSQQTARHTAQAVGVGLATGSRRHPPVPAMPTQALRT